MRFLVDECAGPTLARWLQEQGQSGQFVVVTDTQVRFSSPDDKQK